jgi:hypothetical protein
VSGKRTFKLWDIFKDGDSEVYRLHLGKKLESSKEETVEMQWGDYHWGDESRPE